MDKILRWVGYIFIVSGFISLIYIWTNLKVLDPTSVFLDDLGMLDPHPYRVPIAIGTFFSAFAIGILFVAAGNVYEKLMGGYESKAFRSDPRDKLKHRQQA
ncbi:hypothetical protein JMA_22020 [Jeotgalibacillus malaysiensis]|uniref:Uncharacterized protein n=1 Tax=Jeotgalibacillus malaysiensis TaxID=1508404 RepID=A0A0B5AU30_9BACL|nr:hypothetical protein [Jeotgalibacillus malaysiensis]AJD91519.1 hypothetical protein JMA_22020 [Jeotgalibacillus malaysiensis]